MEHISRFIKKYRKEVIVGTVVFLWIVLRDMIKSLL